MYSYHPRLLEDGNVDFLDELNGEKRRDETSI